MPGCKRPASDSAAAVDSAQTAEAGGADAASAAEYLLVHDISIRKAHLLPSGDDTAEPASGDEDFVCPDPILSFTDAPFDSRLARELRTTMGFSAPAPVQAACWPAAMGGFDTVVVAQTGSGKTIGYLLPIFDAIIQRQKSRQRREDSGRSAVVGSAPGGSPYALVLAPTRELVVQIHEQAAVYGGAVGITSIALYGGVARAGQLAGCRMRPMLVVAAPGRLVDFLSCDPRPALNIARTGLLVLDEADRMLDMGFAAELRGIIQRLPAPAERQTLLFTATWPLSVRRLAAELLRPSHTVSVSIGQNTNFGQTQTRKSGSGELVASKSIKQIIFAMSSPGSAADAAKEAEADQKLFEILDIVLGGENKQATVIVFVNRKAAADNLATRIRGHSVLWTAAAIHGDRSQADRQAALKRFATKTVRVLVATDVAARGLDIKGVDCVVNYDFPAQKAKAVDNYVHRIGRCGRAGASGVAYTIFRPNEFGDALHAKALLKVLKNSGQPRPLWLKQLGKKHSTSKKRERVQKEAARLGRLMSQHRHEHATPVCCTSHLAETEASYDRDDGQRREDAAKRRMRGNVGPKEYGKR